MKSKITSALTEQIKASKYVPTIRRLKINNKEIPDREDYIQAFGLLPDFVLKANNILLDKFIEGDLGVLIKAHREHFKAINRWLVHFANNSKANEAPDPPELHFSTELNYKPYAEMSWALLNLCEEILKRDLFGWTKPTELQPDPKLSDPKLSASELWFSCEFERLENTFKTTGILGATERKGKQSSCDAMLKQIKENYDSLLSRRVANAGDFKPEEIQILHSTEDAINVHAEIIAKKDINFSNNIYLEYLNILKRGIRNIRNNSYFQSAVLEDGSLCEGAKGKRGKGKKKGFVKESND